MILINPVILFTSIMKLHLTTVFAAVRRLYIMYNKIDNRSYIYVSTYNLIKMTVNGGNDAQGS